MSDAILIIENQLSQNSSIYFSVITSGDVTATPSSGTIGNSPEDNAQRVKFTGLNSQGQVVPLNIRNSPSSGAFQIGVKMEPPATSTVQLSAKP